MKAKWLSLIAATTVIGHTLAAPPATSPPRLTVELRDGSRVVGTSTTDDLRFTSTLLGKVKLAVQDIRTVEFVSSNSVKLKAANGDTFALQPLDSALALKTGFGKVELATGSIRKISVSAGSISAPQRDGLVGFWSGNGNPNDASGTNNGVLSGNAGYAVWPAGQVFNFESPGSFVKIPRAPELDPGSQVTVEFWMKAAADNAMQNYQGLVTSDFYGVEISNGYGGTMGVNFFACLNGPSSFRRMGLNSGFYDGTTTVANFTHISDANSGGAVVSAGQWHHVAGTYDGYQLRLYIDGQPWGRPVMRRGGVPPMLPRSFVSIGSEDGRTTCPDCLGGRYFKGAVGNVAIYRRALSLEEIREDYEAQKSD